MKVQPVAALCVGTEPKHADPGRTPHELRDQEVIVRSGTGHLVKDASDRKVRAKPFKMASHDSVATGVRRQA